MEEIIESLNLHVKFLSVPLYRILLGLIIIFIGVVLKNLISKLITRLLHFLYKKKLPGDTLGSLESHVLKPLEKLIFYLFLYIGYHQFDRIFQKIILLRRDNVFAASGMLKDSHAVSASTFIEYGLLFLVLFYIVLVITRFVDFLYMVSIIQANIKKERERQQILPLMKDVSKVVIWFFGIFVILGLLFKVDIATIIAGLGIGGIAIAFAAKDSLENLIASFMVLVDKPFMIGDWISIDSTEGKVEKVGFRSTRIRSVDRSLIIIPNKKLIDGKLINISANGVRRVKFNIKLKYGLKSSDILHIQEEIKDVLKGTKHVVRTPLVYIENLDTGLLEIAVRYFVSMKEEVREEYVRHEVNLRIYEVLNQYTKDFEYIDLSKDKDS